jgi:flagellar motor switch/type III secretory pathway protein FliN
MSTALVNQQPQLEDPGLSTWKEAQYLTCDLAVQVIVDHFTVRDLLQLSRGSVVDTGCKQASNLPLLVNAQMVAWVEFELLGDRLAVRMMELV